MKLDWTKPKVGQLWIVHGSTKELILITATRYSEMYPDWVYWYSIQHEHYSNSSLRSFLEYADLVSG